MLDKVNKYDKVRNRIMQNIKQYQNWIIKVTLETDSVFRTHLIRLDSSITLINYFVKNLSK